MKFLKSTIAVTSLALLLGSAYGSASAAGSNRSAAQSAGATTQTQKSIKAQVDAILLQKKKPGEIYYIYVNDKKYNPGGFAYWGTSYSLPIQNYDEYVQKAGVLKTPFLQLQQAPEGFEFQSAYIGPYKPQTWSIEGQKLSKQIVAEGKASGKTVYVKKVTETRRSVSLTYAERLAFQEKGAYLTITAEPAGEVDPEVDYAPSLAKPEKLDISGQELTYKTGDALIYKTANSTMINNSKGAHYLEWIDSRTRISYTIYASGGKVTKESLAALAEQIIRGQ
ncbi:hypothetical protein J7E73_12480 [Paenibacillus albidus]|nr:hypothetical protein [Paenibacillus albidus]